MVKRMKCRRTVWRMHAYQYVGLQLKQCWGQRLIFGTGLATVNVFQGLDTYCLSVV
jgi:hypothetical protein